MFFVVYIKNWIRIKQIMILNFGNLQQSINLKRKTLNYDGQLFIFHHSIN